MWYAGPDFVPRPVRPLGLHPPDYAQNNGEHLWDVDGDGRKDVLIDDGWYEQPENPWEDNGRYTMTGNSKAVAARIR